MNTQVELEIKRNRNIWMVSFGKNGAANIDAQTGDILTLANFAKLHDGISQASKSISRDTALRKAEQLVSVNNLMDVSSLTVESISPIDNFGGSPCNLMRIVWQRSFKSFPFRNDKVILDFNPETMEVIGYSNCLLSKDPASAAVNISDSDAIAKASSIIKNKGIDAAPGLLTKLEVVNPNYYWTSTNTGEESNNTRLAWIVLTYKSQTVQQAGEIWIDAENGNVIGGTEVR